MICEKCNHKLRIYSKRVVFNKLFPNRGFGRDIPLASVEYICAHCQERLDINVVREYFSSGRVSPGVSDFPLRSANVEEL